MPLLLSCLRLRKRLDMTKLMMVIRTHLHLLMVIEVVDAGNQSALALLAGDGDQKDDQDDGLGLEGDDIEHNIVSAATDHGLKFLLNALIMDLKFVLVLVLSALIMGLLIFTTWMMVLKLQSEFKSAGCTTDCVFTERLYNLKFANFICG